MKLKETIGAIAVAGSLAAAAPAAPSAPADPTLAPYVHPGRLVEIAPHRRIHLICRGTGAPAVILSAGLGLWSASWSHVQPEVARFTRVCAWDRAGFGFSDASPEPQTLDRTTADLERLLRRAGIPGPYVLVGHSAGGFESLVYADRHPGRVAGMVLVDSTVPDQERRTREAAPAIASFYRRIEQEQLATGRRCQAALRSGALRAGMPDPLGCFDYPPAYPEALKRKLARLDADPARYATQQSLFRTYAAGEADRAAVNPRRNYGAMPLIVLSAGQRVLMDGAPAEAAAQYPTLTVSWYRAHEALAALSTRGVHRIVPGGTHSMQRQKPEAVIAAIGEVVEAVRGDESRRK